MRRLDLAVDPLLLRREAVEIQFRRRRQGLDDVLHRVAVHPVPEIEQEHGDLRVGEELRENVAPGQILRHRMVIGEVAVVHQGLVHPDERMRAARMPHAALRRKPLVGDPDVGARVGHAVVLHGGLGEADDLEDDQVPRVGQHERPLVAQGGVEPVVQRDRVLVDELVFHFPLGKARRVQFLLFGETREHGRLEPDEVAGHVRGPDRKERHVAVIVHGGDQAPVVDVEAGLDEGFFHLAPGVGVQQGDLENVVFVEHPARHAHFFRHQPAGGDPAALAVAAVAHLDGRLVDVFPAHGDRAGEPGDAAAALRFRRAGRPRFRRPQVRAGAEQGLYPAHIDLAAFARCGRTVTFHFHNPGASADRCGPARRPRSRVPGDTAVPPASAARRCTGSPAAACTTRR